MPTPLSLRREMASIYRQILRTHRKQLPAEMRQLGDTYVRDEFKRHLSAEEKHLQPFVREWKLYLANMRLQPILGIGKNLAPDELLDLSEEQRDQLHKLRDEARKVAGARQSGE